MIMDFSKLSQVTKRIRLGEKMAKIGDSRSGSAVERPASRAAERGAGLTRISDSRVGAARPASRRTALRGRTSVSDSAAMRRLAAKRRISDKRNREELNLFDVVERTADSRRRSSRVASPRNRVGDSNRVARPAARGVRKLSDSEKRAIMRRTMKRAADSRSASSVGRALPRASARPVSRLSDSVKRAMIRKAAARRAADSATRVVRPVSRVGRTIDSATRPAMRPTKFRSSAPVKDSKMTYARLRKRVKDSIEELELSTPTEIAEEVSQYLTEATPEQVITAVVEVLNETASALEERKEEVAAAAGGGAAEDIQIEDSKKPTKRVSIKRK